MTSSGRFQKSKFFRKNTTQNLLQGVSFKSSREVGLEMLGWRFFLKPVGLELAFLNTGTNLCLELNFAVFFFIFLF